MTTIITATISTFDFGHDMNGNATAKYELSIEDKRVYIARRRQQTGYKTTEHAAAKVKLRDTLGNYWRCGHAPHPDITSALRCGEALPSLFIPDPAHHPWLFGQRLVFPSLDRYAHNTLHYLCGNHASVEEFMADVTVARRRLLGLLPPYIDGILCNPDGAHRALVGMLGEEYLRQLHESKPDRSSTTGSAMGDQAMLDMLATTINDLNIKKEFTHED